MEKRPDGSNADQWNLCLEDWTDKSGGHPYVAVQIAEAIDDAERRGALLNPPQVFMYSDNHGICIGGRFHGWIMWKHPDGQFVTVRKLEGQKLCK
jgi:hypothetical protein